MNWLVFTSSVLLAVAVAWSLALLRRIRDWRAGFVIAWLGAMLLLLVITFGLQAASERLGVDASVGWLRQLAISGVAVAAVIFHHVTFQRDPLTGLPNRALFMNRLRRAIARANRSTFAVLFVDLDRFKLINDSLGRAVGDQLLVAVAERLEGCIKRGDTIARLGSDEFVLLLRGLDRGDASDAAEAVQHELLQPLYLNGQEVFTSASIGISASSSSHTSAEEMIREADLAMYRAKALGKSRHAVFDVSLHHHAIERLKVESDLRRAAERGEFVLWYQPIVMLADGRVSGFEALLRWDHPERGLLLPDKFIPVAEETGLILPVGLWVLEEACRQMYTWQKLYPAMQDRLIHVNLSGRQFTLVDLADKVSDILARTGLEPGSLALEITETVVMGDGEKATRVLGRLRALGVILQIDDFGTGYSSLSYLSRFPIDTLKIDGSFVMGTGANGENAKIVRSIITLARDLELDVVAEGIETAKHLRLLKSLGCRFGQGHHFYKAMSAEAVEKLLSKNAAGFDRAPHSSRGAVLRSSGRIRRLGA